MVSGPHGAGAPDLATLLARISDIRTRAADISGETSKRLGMVDELATLAETSADKTVRARSTQALATLANIDENTTLDTMMKAAGRLARLKTPEGQAQLDTLLGRTPTYHNTHAALLNFIGDDKDKVTVAKVESVARTHPFVSIRAQAIGLLAGNGTDAARAVVNHLARKDLNEDIRAVALKEAGSHHMQGCVSLLDFAARQDPHASVQQVAIGTLANLAMGEGTTATAAMATLRGLAQAQLPISNAAEVALLNIKLNGPKPRAD